MLKSVLRVTAFVVVSLGAIQPLFAATILNVDLNGHNPPPATSAGTYYSDSSSNPVAPGGGGLWNGLDIEDQGSGMGVNATYTANTDTNTTGTPTASTGNFEYNDGSASPITIKLAGFVSADHNINNANTTNTLLADYIIQTAPAQLTLNNVPAGTYNLYVFATNARAGVGGSFTVGSTTLATLNSTSSLSPLIAGTDYVEFPNVTIPSGGGPLVINAGDGTGLNVGVMNGFQLVSTPEPGSIALLACGGLALLPRRRH